MPKILDAKPQHTNNNTQHTHLNSGFGNPRSIHRHDGSQDGFAQERRHENGPEGGGRRHQNGQRHVSLGNVRAQVAGLTPVDASDEHHARNERSAQTKGLAESEGQGGHHGVAEGELHDDGYGLLGALDKVIRSQGDPHAQHECGKAGREVLSGEPRKGLRAAQGHAGKEHGPEGKEIGGHVCRLFVRFKDFLSQGFLIALKKNRKR